MIASGHHQSGFKTQVLRGRNWRALRGLGQAGRTTAPTNRTGTTTTTASGPAGGTAALISLRQRQLQASQTQTAANTPVVVTRPSQTTTTTTQGTQGTQTTVTVQKLPPGNYTYSCPMGTYYSNGQCIANPTAAAAQGSSMTQACASGYTLDPTSGNCVAATTTTDYLPWILGGAGVLLLIMLAIKK